jgi:hypothetical protein
MKAVKVISMTHPVRRSLRRNKPSEATQPSDFFFKQTLLEYLSSGQSRCCCLSYVHRGCSPKEITRHQHYPHDTPFQRQLESDGSLSESLP